MYIINLLRPFRHAFAALAVAGFPFLASAAEIEVNGVTLNYEEAGTGSVVLFVHGAISDRRTWTPYRDAIAGSRRFVAYDQRYFGTREWPDDGTAFSADTHAADLVALVEALDAGPVNLVAWSYGGDVAARAAVARPDLFKAIIYYEPDVYGLIEGLPGAARATEILYRGYGAAFAAVEENRLEDASLRFLEGVFQMAQGGANTEPEAMRTMWRENGRTIPPYLSAPSGDTATCADLGVIRAPTLVIRGSDSMVYDVMMAERLAACQPNAVVVTMDGVNHDGPYRKPSEFADMIDDFLDLVE